VTTILNTTTNPNPTESTAPMSTPTYHVSKFGHFMGQRAEAIGDLLLERAPECVTGEELSAVSGLSPASVGWYIFQLRCLGFVVENVRGRGWRLVDAQAVTPTDRESFAEGRRVAALVVRPRSPRVARALVREQVRHATLGLGTIVFDRPGFPKVAVEFGGRVEKVSREELERPAP